jgi:hypothetical protein
MLLALFWTRETIKMHKKAAVGPINYAFHSKRHSGGVAGGGATCRVGSERHRKGAGGVLRRLARRAGLRPPCELKFVKI